MQHALLFLSAKDAAALRLERVAELTRSGESLTYLHCDFVSDEGQYLRVKVSYKGYPIMLMIPHHLVKLVIQVPNNKAALGFARQISAASKNA